MMEGKPKIVYFAICMDKRNHDICAIADNSRMSPEDKVAALAKSLEKPNSDTAHGLALAFHISGKYEVLVLSDASANLARAKEDIAQYNKKYDPAAVILVYHFSLSDNLHKGCAGTAARDNLIMHDVDPSSSDYRDTDLGRYLRILDNFATYFPKSPIKLPGGVEDYRKIEDPTTRLNILTMVHPVAQKQIIDEIFPKSRYPNLPILIVPENTDDLREVGHDVPYTVTVRNNAYDQKVGISKQLVIGESLQLHAAKPGAFAERAAANRKKVRR